MFTPAQLQTLKADMELNAATVVVGGQVQVIGDIAADPDLQNGDSAQAVADWYTATPAEPVYWLWKTACLRGDIYNLSDDLGGAWSWTAYKNQTAMEQGAWLQMATIGGTNNPALPMHLLNVRAGIQAIFGGAAPGNAQRDHCFAIGRRRANAWERSYVLPVVNPPVNTGNDGVPGNRGKPTNPDLPGIGDAGNILEGTLPPGEVQHAWNS